MEAWNNRITCRTNSALRVWNSNHVKFHDNIIDSFHHWSAGGPGIQIEKGPDSSNQTAIVNDVEVYNNTICNSFGPGIWMPDYDESTSIGDQGKSVHIHHNIFYRTGTNPSITSIGGIVANGFNGTLIENNLFDRCYGAAIYLTSPPEYIPAGGLFKITVRNNTIVNTQEGTIDPNGTGYAAINNFPQIYDLVLQNNSLYNNVRGDYKNCTSTTYIYVNPLADQKNHDYQLLSVTGRWDGIKWVDAGKDIAIKLNNIVACIAPAQSVSPIVNETQITTNVSYKEFPSIYGDRIVWQDYRNGDLGNASWDIYMYDIATSKETRITTNKSWQENPEIFGDRIVWEDGRNGNQDIYMYNISTSTETRITNDESDNTHPAIYGDRIVWERHDGGNHDICMYTISTHKVTQITKNGKAYNPAIYDDRIVWEDYRLADEYDLSSSDIFKYDLSTHRVAQISTSGRAHNSAIYGDRIVWYDFRNGNDDIYMYNITASSEIQITTNISEQEFPAIFGDRIVWQDYRNVQYNPDIYG